MMQVQIYSRKFRIQTDCTRNILVIVLKSANQQDSAGFIHLYVCPDNQLKHLFQ